MSSTMYATGTVAVTNGSPNIVGSGTSWVKNAKPGQGILIINGTRVDVLPIYDVTGDGAIVVQFNYLGTTASGLSYCILPFVQYAIDAAAALASAELSFQAYTGLAPSDGNYLRYVGSPTAVPTIQTAQQVITDLLSNTAEVNVASSSTTDIGAATSPRTQITSTNTIASLGTTKNAMRWSRFAGALTMTNSATLVMPGATDLITAANDVGLFTSDNSSTPVWRLASYLRANGTIAPFIAGSAATPSHTFPGDTNTGIFNPSADIIALAVGGAEMVRASSGGVRIGGLGVAARGPLDINVDTNPGVYLTSFGGPSSSPYIVAQVARGTRSVPLHVNNGDALLTIRTQGFGTTDFFGSGAEIAFEATEDGSDTAQGQRMVLYTQPNTTIAHVRALTLHQNGHVSLDPTSADLAWLTVAGNAVFTTASATALVVGRQGTTNPGLLVNASTATCVTGLSITPLAAGSGIALTAISSATDESIIITPKGAGVVSLAGPTSMVASGTVEHKAQVSGTGVYALGLRQSHASNPIGLYINYSAVDPNDTTHDFLECYGSNFSVLRAAVRSNGGLANFSANNVNLSDAGVKHAIEYIANDNALAGALWDAHKQMRWSRSKYDDQTHDDFNWGYTAQDVRDSIGKVAPYLVDFFNGQDGPLGVFHHDITNISGAVLTIAQGRIDDHETRIALLEAENTALRTQLQRKAA